MRRFVAIALLLLFASQTTASLICSNNWFYVNSTKLDLNLNATSISKCLPCQTAQNDFYTVFATIANGISYAGSPPNANVQPYCNYTVEYITATIGQSTPPCFFNATLSAYLGCNITWLAPATSGDVEVYGYPIAVFAGMVVGAVVALFILLCILRLLLRCCCDACEKRNRSAIKPSGD